MALDVSRATAQVRSRLAVFSTPQRIIIGLLAGVSLLAVFVFVRWVSAPSYDTLLSGLEATDAAAVTAQLEGAGVPFKLAAGGTTVLVPADQLQAQRLAVAAAGLPEGTTKGYKQLDEAGMTSSSFQQKIAYQRAVEGELSATLEQMGEVRKATVMLSLPEDELYTDKEKPARASVLLETKGSMPRESVESVQHLVAAAVPDLEPSGVTVSDTKGRLLSDSKGGGSGRMEAEQGFEDAKAARADSMLASVLGPGMAVVRVDADIDTAAKVNKKETYDPTKSVVLRKTDNKEKYDATGTALSGIVSVPDPGGIADGGKTDSKYDKSENTVENGVTREVNEETIGPGAIKRLSVAVVVDNKAKGLPTDQVLSKLVADAVGLNLKRGDTITVASIPFSADTVVEPPPLPRDWASTATVGIAVLLLLLVALAFWRAARRTTTDLVVVPTVVEEEETPPVVAIKAKALESARTEEIQNDLRILELVDSRPDEVSALIRGWLAEPTETKVKK